MPRIRHGFGSGVFELVSWLGLPLGLFGFALFLVFAVVVIFVFGDLFINLLLKVDRATRLESCGGRHGVQAVGTYLGCLSQRLFVGSLRLVVAAGWLGIKGQFASAKVVDQNLSCCANVWFSALEAMEVDEFVRLEL